MPALPPDLTDVDDRDLMELLVALTGWADYSGGLLSMAEVDEAAASAVRDKADAVSFVRHWTGGPGDRVNATKAQRSVDEEVLAARQQVLECYARRKLLAATFAAAERNAAVVSRELTRRTSRDPTHRRAERFTP